MPEPDADAYFTATDADILLLNHPDPEWQGEPVDAAFFQLTGGTSPIHIWNYARRTGRPAMSNQQQDQRLDELQKGTSGGAPFDDTAESNMQVSLQLLINEERFQDTYYQFRSMSEIGDVTIRYNKQTGYRNESTAGYRLLEGHVATVSRESSGRNATYPSIELTFRNMRPLDRNLVEDTSEFAPSGRQRGGPGVSKELQAQGLGRTENQENVFSVVLLNGWVGDTKTQDALGNVPNDLSGFDRLSLKHSFSRPGVPENWISNQDFSTAIILVQSPKGPKRAFLWRPDDGEYQELQPREESLDTISSLAPAGALQTKAQ